MFKNLNFREDLEIFFEKLQKENISFSRFGDGEMMIIKKQKIDLLNKDNGEFRYCPDEPMYIEPRRLLHKALTKKMENYYVSISCPCCVGEKKHLQMLKESSQDEGKVTWANLFVNSNYYFFMSNMFRYLKNKEVYLISNKKSDINKFPLKIVKHYPVSKDSWLNDLSLIDEIKSNINDKQIKNSCFLFCAGPLSNIACCELFEYNKDNTYLDCGSVFDDILGLGKTRGYLRGAPTLKKTCIWSKK